jgi:hypothetical protein
MDYCVEDDDNKWIWLVDWEQVEDSIIFDELWK